MDLAWSDEYWLSAHSIANNAPVTSGVYEILQSHEYPRYRGATRNLKIGVSKNDLSSELANHDIRHTAANRLARVRSQPRLTVSFKYVILGVEAAGNAEKALLKDFEDHHWDLPVLNSQRGYGRGEDRHYRGQ